MIVMVLLLGIFFALRRNGNAGNGNGGAPPAGVAETTPAEDVSTGHGTEVAVPESTEGPAPEDPPGEDPDDSLEDTLNELNSLSAGQAEPSPGEENST